MAALSKTTSDLLLEITDNKAELRQIEHDMDESCTSSIIQNVTGHALLQKDKLKRQACVVNVQLMNRQAKMHMMALAMGEKLSIDEDEVGQQKASVEAKYSQSKAKVKAKKASLIKLAEDTENYYELTQSKLSQLQTKISQLEENQAKISAMKERNSCVKGERSAHVDVCISKAKAGLEDSKREVSQMKQEIEDRRHEAAVSTHVLADLGKENDSKSDFEQVEKNDDCLEWMKDLGQTLTKMSGIESCFVDEHSLEINFQAPIAHTAVKMDEGIDGEQSSPALQLTVTYKKVKASFVLADAQLDSCNLSDSCNLDIRDVVTSAVARNDLKYLVSRVYNRWCKHLPLYIEVCQLRKKYALDWQQDQGLIHVLYGNDGHIVCTLRLANGLVDLIAIEGLKGGKNLDDFRVKRSLSLTKWLDHLGLAIKAAEEKLVTS